MFWHILWTWSRGGRNSLISRFLIRKSKPVAQVLIFANQGASPLPILANQPQIGFRMDRRSNLGQLPADPPAKWRFPTKSRREPDLAARIR